MKKLSYEEGEKWYIKTNCTATEEEIESWKTKYYCGLNTYDEFKSLLRKEYKLYSRPKLIQLMQQLYFLYLELKIGCWRFKSSFEDWRFIMKHDLDRLNQRCHGLNVFDEFYSGLNGGWRGV